MTTIPTAAIDAAVSSYMESMAAEGFISHEGLSAAFEKVLLAALPHLSKPVEWQRYVDNVGWMIVEPEDLAHYREKGSTIRSLYLAPPAPAVAVKPLEWGRDGDTYISNDAYTIYDNGPNWDEDRYRLYIGHKPAENFPSIEAAKAAAQADYEQRIRSALVDAPSPLPSIPAGWKLVPVEPTIDMVTAPAIDHEDSATPDASERVYRAMLAAAPEPPFVCNETAPDDTQQRLCVLGDPTTAPGHTDLMVDPETIDAFTEVNPPPDEAPKISLRDAAWNLLYARDRDNQVVGYRADLWDCLRAILENGTVTGPSSAEAAALAAYEKGGGR